MELFHIIILVISFVFLTVGITSICTSYYKVMVELSKKEEETRKKTEKLKSEFSIGE